MSRAQLPGRRPHLVLEFEHGGIPYKGSASFDLSTGEVTEIFLNGGKPGTELDAMSRDLGVVVSLARQHGASIEIIRKALTRLDDNSAAGPMGAMLDQIVEAFQ